MIQLHDREDCTRRTGSPCTRWDADHPQHPEYGTRIHGVSTVHTFETTPQCGTMCWHHDYPEPTPEQDMRYRWRLNLTAHAAALTALSDPELPEGTLAMIPLVQPGKDHGVWRIGQPVEVIPGVIILATRGGLPGEDVPVNGRVLDYCAARALADDIATAYLAGRDGTGGHAVVYPSGDTFIHEGF